MAINENLILEQLMERAPFASRADARAAFQATLAALRAGMTDDEAQALSQELEGDAAAQLRGGQYCGELSPEELYRRVANRQERRPSLAKEQAQVVCVVLAELIPEESRQRLCRHLPQLAPLFEHTLSPEPPQGAEHQRIEPEQEHTLAAGKPGSSRPLSQARPTSSRPLSEAQPDNAHAHSVARSDDPHADTRLSSSRGLTQEREEESLARSRLPFPD